MPLSVQTIQIQPCPSKIKVVINPNNQNTAQPHSVNPSRANPTKWSNTLKTIRRQNNSSCKRLKG